MIKVVCILFSMLFWLDVASGQSYWVKTYIAIDSRQSYYFYQDSRVNQKHSYTISNTKKSDGILEIGVAKEWENGSFTELNLFRQKNNSAKIGFYFDTIGSVVTSRTPFIGKIKEVKFILAADHLVLLSKPEKTFRFYAGGSMMAHSAKINFKADPAYYFDMDKRFTNIDLGGAIKLAYTILDNLWVECGINVGIISFGVENSKISNPVFTPQQQENTVFEVDLLESSNIRLGLGYRFYHKNVKT